jgi:8-oxo-dGTP diphosphatase
MTLDRTRPLSGVTVAVFARHEDQLWALLVKPSKGAGRTAPERWILPEGSVDVEQDADLLSCTRRILKEKAGVTAAYVEQLGSWGSGKRDPRGWSATHAYIALVSAKADTFPPPGTVAGARWSPIVTDAVEFELALDHAEILAAAVSRLRSKSEYTSLPAYLVPPEFTLSELQRAYEIVLGRKLEKSAFRTRILAADLVTPLGRFREGANRPAKLHRLRHRAPVYFPRPLQPKD